ncbi:glycosyltransferase family 2 protein [Diaminobutyricimonas aerilata]|uniref:glycosyltransferase family 2 protein n=1 Tax=Diaminobutyricimonas aerilata TaxID=1162967 RepID=UPI001FEBD44F|nr:glycosyltransferase [Diaminobutyricimonas aerilata]
MITPVYETDHDVLRQMVESVRAQTFANWELILVDDASPSNRVRIELAGFAGADDRIRVVLRESNGGIVAASNDALGAARGEFVALVDHDDVITEDALAEVAEAIKAEPEADYIYSDEDKITVTGELYDRFDKPDWSPERLRGQMYTGHLSVLRRSIVAAVGGFDPAAEGSQDHDLVLKVTERARKVVHIPRVLYHWRAVAGSTAASNENKSYAWDNGCAAVNAHLVRVGIRGRAELGPVPGTYRVVRDDQPGRLVSVVIPTRGTAGVVFGEERVFVVDAVRSILEHTAHEAIEFVIVYDSDTPADVLESLEEVAGPKLRLVPYLDPFNFSRKCNVGVLASRGEYVLVVNDDIRSMSDRIVETMIGPLAESDVGMTGAFLFYEDGTIQHAGHSHHMGDYTHAYHQERPDAYGAFSSLLINREAAGLTAAFIGMRRDVYEDAGGFSELLPGNFNDVDLCMKVRSLGYRLVWLTDARLHHFESKSRNPLVHSYEEKTIVDRWGRPERDPYLA